MKTFHYFSLFQVFSKRQIFAYNIVQISNEAQYFPIYNNFKTFSENVI